MDEEASIGDTRRGNEKQMSFVFLWNRSEKIICLFGKKEQVNRAKTNKQMRDLFHQEKALGNIGQ